MRGANLLLKKSAWPAHINYLGQLGKAILDSMCGTSNNQTAYVRGRVQSELREIRISYSGSGDALQNRLIALTFVEENIGPGTINGGDTISSIQSGAVEKIIEEAYALNRTHLVKQFSQIVAVSRRDPMKAMEELVTLASCTVSPEELKMMVSLGHEMLSHIDGERRMMIASNLLEMISEAQRATSNVAEIHGLLQAARTLMRNYGIDRAGEVTAIVIDRVLDAREREKGGARSDVPKRQPGTSCASVLELEYVLLNSARTKEPAELQLPYHAARMLAEMLPPAEALPAVGATLDDLSKSGDESVALSIAELFGASLRNAGDMDYVRELLNLLKFPASVGEVTEYVLQRLRERFHNLDRPQLDHWAAVVWAEETFPKPKLDLASPPRLPSGGVVRGPFA